MRRRSGTGWAAALLAAFGAILLGASLLMDRNSVMAELYSVEGAIIVAIAILFYFLSPSRYLRSEVSDAISISNTMSLNKILSSIAAGSKCYYVPSDIMGATKVFMPLSPGKYSFDLTNAIGEMSDNKGVYITPPGYGLYEYLKSIGATFTPSDMASEIKDVMVRTLEIATRVDVERRQDIVDVTLYGVASMGMCNSLRKQSADMCSQTGCPICSLVACIVAESTGKGTMIDRVTVDKKSVRLSLKLV